MQRIRTEKEIYEMVELARAYCSELANYRYAKAEGRLSPLEDDDRQQVLARMDEKLALLKSNNELDRRRARAETNIIPLARYKRKAAK